MPVKLILYAILGSAILGAVVFGYSTVSGWHEDSKLLEATRQQLQSVIADREAYKESARLSAEQAGLAERRLDDMIKMKQQVRVIYREATSTDPDCMAWVSAPIRCPLDGVRLDTGAIAGAEARLP